MDTTQTPIGDKLNSIRVRFDEGPSFQAWSDGDTWNGFAVPYFTKVVADDVAYFSTNHPGYATITYDAENDRYLADDGWDEPLAFDGFDREGLHLYGIGAYYWTWTRDA